MAFLNFEYAQLLALELSSLVRHGKDRLLFVLFIWIWKRHTIMSNFCLHVLICIILQVMDWHGLISEQV
jgi:hypothetical protein